MVTPAAPRRKAGMVTGLQYEFTDVHFDAIRELVTAITGVQLPDMKRQLTYSRFAKRMRELGIDSFDEYIARLRDPATKEIEALPSIITTNVTSFLREPHHFEYLRESVLPALRRAARVRIWSSACSTGEEPYSIASVVADVLGDATGQVRGDVRILATDIDDRALARASVGIYPAAKVPPAFAARWMDDIGGGQLEVRPALRRLVTFKPLNLLGDWPMRGPFDVIFCRNVVIYFDQDTKSKLFTRQARLQRPGDVLMIGHSEQLTGPVDDYRRTAHTVYEKIR